MIAGIRCLLKAAQSHRLVTDVLDNNNNLVQVIIKDCAYTFVNSTTPLLDHATAQIMRDKYFTYLLLSRNINMPVTRQYLDPDVAQIYQQYVQVHDRMLIRTQIKSQFGLPVVIKPNQSTQGRNVSLVNDFSDISPAIDRIFDHASKEYDYVALAQEYIEPTAEYRVIVVDGNIQLVYRKVASVARPGQSLSPLHRPDSSTVKVNDVKLMQKLNRLISRIDHSIKLTYCGLDIIEDRKGHLWLIELNASPGYSHYIQDNGEADIIKVYTEVLNYLVMNTA